MVMRLDEFDSVVVVPILHVAAADAVHDVRWSARFRLFQMGLGSDPGPDGDPGCDDDESVC